MSLLPIILSGGAGKRLWPLSRQGLPKPFIQLDSGENLLQLAFGRAQALPKVTEVLTVTRRDLYAPTAVAYREIARPDVTTGYLLEPVARNTAAAVTAATVLCQARHPDATLLFLTADHLIGDSQAFEQAVLKACRLAAGDDLVIFGIRPSRAEVSYGYIQADGNRVVRFVEKPDRPTAQTYVDSGFLWNSGMLCARVSTLQAQLAQHTPDLLRQVQAGLDAMAAADQVGSYRIEIDAASYESITSGSIDYELLEKSKQIAVVACDLDWSDVGNWSTLAERRLPDTDGNRLQGETVLYEARGCYIHSTSRLVAVAGVNNLVVVDTPDAALVMNNQSPDLVEQIVAQLHASQHPSCFQQAVEYHSTGADTPLETEPADTDESIGERTAASYVVQKKAASHRGSPADIDWIDIGRWNSIGEQLAPDTNGNRSQGAVVLAHAQNCTIHATDRLVAAAGVGDMTIIDTSEALLVIDSRRPQLVNHLLHTLRSRGLNPPPGRGTVYRSWGTYTVLETGRDFKIKRLRVKPGASLSLQMHHHRSEHWVVLEGTAKVLNGEQEMLIERHQSTYIPAGCLHRLSNAGTCDLIMIEVQSGPYLEEDDIVRFDPPPGAGRAG